jgi:hypothetical protein
MKFRHDMWYRNKGDMVLLIVQQGPTIENGFSCVNSTINVWFTNKKQLLFCTKLLIHDTVLFYSTNKCVSDSSN